MIIGISLLKYTNIIDFFIEFQKDLLITVEAPAGSKALDVSPINVYSEQEILM